MRKNDSGIPGWALPAFAALMLALGLVIGVWLHSNLSGSDKVKAVAVTPKKVAPPVRLRKPDILESRTETGLPPATAGSNHRHRHNSQRVPASSAAVATSFGSVESAISGSIGLAVAPLTPGSIPQTFGELQVGHAWSSMKVPIVTTLLREGALSPEEETDAYAAVTASDNEAAAALFSHLESTHGGLTGASQALRETLAAAGDPATEIATAPPPPGAVSTWGQTEWPLTSSVTFYRSLACNELLNQSQSAYVLGLMEEVIPEQQWGLGQASFPPGTSVAYKAGWGPEAETGGYLVRQAGVIRQGSRGLVVTMAAEDSSGSFESGVTDVDQIANWVAENMEGLDAGPC